MKISDKRIAALLAVLMSLGLASCTKTDPAPGPGTGLSTDSAAESGPVSGVPAGTDFDGEEVRIWYTTTASSATESLIDIAGELTGDVLDDAIFNANKRVEEKLGVSLDFYNSGIPSGQTGDEVRKLVMADVDEYDLFHSTQWNTAALAAEGLFLNMADADYLSLDQPWWDGGYMKEMTIGEDRIYALVGDYAIDRTRCLSCVFYNKAMFEDFWGNADALYREVLDGSWTMDRMRQISADVYEDLNSDGEMSREDRLGYCVSGGNNNDALFYATGARVTSRDEDDNPIITMNNERTVAAIEKLYQIAYETDGGFYSGTGSENSLADRNRFTDGGSMFFFGFFYTADAFRDMKDDYGIIPTPKLDEAQEAYCSTVHDIMRLMVVPANCRKADAVSAVLEELAFEGWQNVLPAYYDTVLKDKYVRDNDSAAMLDLIRDNCRPDIAYIYGDAFGQLGYVYREMMQGKNKDIVSMYTARITAANEKREAFIEQFLGAGN